MSDGSNVEPVASFMDRILRLKSEEDQIKEDIKSVYAEAKATGFDKTALGDAIARIRKMQKDPEKLSERETIRDLYLQAYEDASRTHAHARED
ncbi:MAG TPA: GapR family DNA-binding domain-containing protein [Microvirga sp.]|nr:GapR family DNA-binding domain-containing protein [Microvirga sp.]